MGALFRRYWRPVAASGEMVGRPTKLVRLLGESLVLFRDARGHLGLVADAIPKEIVTIDAPCNWLQIMENSVDQTHYDWLHTRFAAFAREMAGRGSGSADLAKMRTEYEETDYGILKRYSVDDSPATWVVNGPVVFPNVVTTGPAKMPCFQFRVPIDDVTTRQFYYTSYRITAEMKQRLAEAGMCDDLLAGRVVPYAHRPVPELGTALDYSLLDTNVAQDLAVILSQGRIYDRSEENLGRSDMDSSCIAGCSGAS